MLNSLINTITQITNKAIPPVQKTEEIRQPIRQSLINPQELRKLLPSVNEAQFQALLLAMNQLFPTYGLTTKRRVRYFIAQTHHETQGFTKLVENLYYTSAERIVKVWPSRFDLTGTSGKRNAKLYVKNPIKLASAVYANRMGNGSEQSQEGFKYRGRGAMHLTGKYNYRKCSLELYNDERLVVNPDLVNEDMHTCIETALWFWKINNLNRLADEDRFTDITKIINGSTSTVPERLKVLKSTINICNLEQ